MRIDTLDHTLQFKIKHLLEKTVQQNNFNKKIKILASKNNSSWTYHSVDCLVTVPKINKVTINSQFIIVGLPPSVQKTETIQIKLIWCLPLTFFWLSKLKYLN